MRTCPGCSADISGRPVTAKYCDDRECLNARRSDLRARRAARDLARLLIKHKITSTIIRTPVHGWCVRATMPHGPEVYFIDEDDLAFYLAESEKAAA